MIASVISDIPLWGLIGIFIIAGTVITFSGIRLSKLADHLADFTKMGEALMGGIFLGASTSLSGITASVKAAIDGYAELSLSNAIGGIAAQMMMLVVADISYRKVNLEHASASLENLMHGTLQIILLGMLLFALTGPQYTLWNIHFVTPILIVSYIFGMHIVSGTLEKPMWRPEITKDTVTDIPDEKYGSEGSLKYLWSRFLLYAIMTMVTGWIFTDTAEVIASRTGLSQSLVGGVFVAVTTSLSEMVTAVAAVQRGALTLAVADILGGNAFDTLFAAVADIFYREGSIYAGVSQRVSELLTLTIIMAGVLLLGLMRRQKHGIGRIGFESAAVIVIYISGIILLTR